MILAILCFIAGLALLATGIYFLTPGFLSKMNFRHAKISAYVALALGAFTLVWGFMLFAFPQIQSILALIYMFVLLGAVTILMLFLK